MGRQYRILVVDTDQRVGGLIAGALDAESHDVIAVQGGQDAIELLHVDDAIDMVVADVAEEGASGMDVLRWTRTMGRETTFLMMTGQKDTETVEEALRLGVKKFLRKPFDVGTFLDHLPFLKAEVHKHDPARRNQENARRERNHLRQKYVDEVTRNQILHMSVLKTLAMSIDARDTYTHAHSRNVANLAATLGNRAGFERKAVEELYTAGLLHDIGKIGVPESILLKPGTLTRAEFEAIRRHPVTGYAILQPLPDMDDVLAGVLSHHERIDGTGYPNGLRGESIHMYARIISICDAWDAMTSDRPYRDAMAKDRAEEIMRQGAGTQFDPDFLPLALSVLPELEDRDPTLVLESDDWGT